MTWLHSALATRGSLALAVALTLGACSGTSTTVEGEQCDIGAEGCSCFDNGTCAGELACLSDKCVDAAGSTGGAETGGAGAASGGASTGGAETGGGDAGGAETGGAGAASGGVPSAGGSGTDPGSSAEPGVECSAGLCAPGDACCFVAAFSGWDCGALDSDDDEDPCAQALAEVLGASYVACDGGEDCAEGERCCVDPGLTGKRATCLADEVGVRCDGEPDATVLCGGDDDCSSDEFCSPNAWNEIYSACAAR